MVFPTVFCCLMTWFYAIHVATRFIKPLPAGKPQKGKIAEKCCSIQTNFLAAVPIFRVAAAHATLELQRPAQAQTP